jgi:hypothetical protein
MPLGEQTILAANRRKTHRMSARLRLAKLIGAGDVALALRLVHLLPRLGRRVVTVLLNSRDGQCG